MMFPRVLNLNSAPIIIHIPHTWKRAIYKNLGDAEQRNSPALTRLVGTVSAARKKNESYQCY